MNNKKSPFGVGIIIGAVLGGVAAYFLSPKSGKENREMAKQKLDEMKKRVEGKSIDEIVKEIFGMASEEGEKLYTRARNDLNARLDILQESIDEIDRGKYKNIVDEVLENLKNETEITKDRLSRLQEYLMDRWDIAQEEGAQDTKKLASGVKKAAKK